MKKKTIIWKRSISMLLTLILTALIVIPTNQGTAYAIQMGTLLDLSEGSIVIGDGVLSQDGLSKTPDSENCYIIEHTGTTFENTIMITGGAISIILSNVKIDVQAITDACAFDIHPGASVNLRLEGTNELLSADRQPGLRVPKGASLTINKAGPHDNLDSLVAKSTYTGSSNASGIGGGDFEANGTITLLGGTITASGDYGASGIGSGGGYMQDSNPLHDRKGGDITINGGIIIASCQGGTGIGGGYGHYCDIYIGGGDVTAEATNFSFGSGIGGGDNSPAGLIQITGGKVTARMSGGGAAIGNSYQGSPATINISGGEIDAEVNGPGAAIGGGQDTPSGMISITGGVVKANALGSGAAIGDGNGTGTLDTQVNISGGNITATSVYGPAIGGWNGSEASINISGGTIYAKSLSTGIARGDGRITITGGSVNVLDSGLPYCSPLPTNGTQPVYPVQIKLPVTAADGINGLMISQGSPITYGYQDMMLNSQDKLYLFLPAYAQDTQATITAGTEEYPGYQGIVGTTGINALYLNQAPLLLTPTSISCNEVEGPFTVTATGGTLSNPVSFRILEAYQSTVELVDHQDGTADIEILSPGTVTLQASKEGDGIYSTVTADVIITVSPYFVVSAIPEQKYTGNPIKPAIVVTDGTNTLVEGTDYKIEYFDVPGGDFLDDYSNVGYHTFIIASLINTNIYKYIDFIIGAELSNLSFSAGNLTPAFQPGVTSYTLQVANSVSSISITPTANDTANTVVRVNGVTVAAGSSSEQIDIPVGDTSIQVRVRSKDYESVRNYTILVKRAAATSPTPPVTPPVIPPVTPPQPEPMPVSANTPTPTPTQVLPADSLTFPVNIQEHIMADGKLVIPVSTEELNQLLSDPKQTEAAINITLTGSNTDYNRITGMTLRAETLELVKQSGRSLSITVCDMDGRARYTWGFDADSLTSYRQDFADLELFVRMSSATEDTELRDQLGDASAQGLICSFAHDGKLPVQAGVRIYVGDHKDFVSGSKVFLYHYNRETGKLETLPYSSNYVVDADGYVTFQLVHCSDYVALLKKADSDNITSLRQQIMVTAPRNTLYIDNKAKASTQLQIKLPFTLELIASQEKQASQNALGWVKASYSSSNKKVATVNRNGSIKAVGKGTTVIKTVLTLYSGKTKTVNITITVK